MGNRMMFNLLEIQMIYFPQDYIEEIKEMLCLTIAI